MNGNTDVKQLTNDYVVSLIFKAAIYSLLAGNFVCVLFFGLVARPTLKAKKVTVPNIDFPLTLRRILYKA